MLIAVIGLVGCGAKAEKEVAAETEEAATGAGEIEEEVPEVKEEATLEITEEQALEIVEELAQEIVEESAPVKYHEIDFAEISTEFSGTGSDAEGAAADEGAGEGVSEATPFTLTVASEKANNVSEIPDWLEANELSLPMLGGQGGSTAQSDENAPTVTSDILLLGTAFYDENYIYDWTPEGLNIYDRYSCQLLHIITYQMDRWYFMGNCASLQDGILYMGYLYNGYAMPGTCYLLAYDLENDKVLWRSADQTYNTMNFIMKDDIIICGYGFTSEKDFIYQIDKNTGKVVAQLELKKMPEILVEKDGQLYVHSYSYDYVIDVE